MLKLKPAFLTDGDGIGGFILMTLLTWLSYDLFYYPLLRILNAPSKKNTLKKHSFCKVLELRGSFVKAGRSLALGLLSFPKPTPCCQSQLPAGASDAAPGRRDRADRLA